MVYNNILQSWRLRQQEQPVPQLVSSVSKQNKSNQ